MTVYPAIETDSEAGEPTPRTTGLREILAIALLVVGGFLFGFGWLVGLVLLWTSSVWRLRDKLIGTFLLPGGLVPGFILLLAATARFTSSGKVCHGLPLVPGTNRQRVICTFTTTIGHGLNHHALLIALSVLFLIIPVMTAVYLNRRRHIS